MPFTALLDACVLYPVGIRDTLLSVAETGLYRPVWSAHILDETRRNILADLPDLHPDQLDRAFTAMHRAFPDAIVTGHEALTAVMTNDPKDRHVLAAAVTGGAQVIVTFNQRDFPPAACDPYRIDVQHPDQFLDYAFELNPETVITAIAYQAHKRHHPPTTTGQLLTTLEARGLLQFTASIRAHLAHTHPNEPWLRALPLTDIDIGTELTAG